MSDKPNPWMMTQVSWVHCGKPAKWIDDGCVICSKCGEEHPDNIKPTERN